MKYIQFVIPSYQRPDSVLALEMFPGGYVPHIIVRAEEQEAYEKNYGHKAKIVPITGVTGIADTRRKITEMYAGQRIWMLDDDTYLTTSYIRTRDNRRVSNKTKMTQEEFDLLNEETNLWMDLGFVHGHGRYPVFLMPGITMPYRENSYGFTNTFYDLTQITAEDIGYGITSLCEDCYSFLRLISKGYNHLAVMKYVAITGKAGAPGGCSTIRDNSKHNEALAKIVEDFPQYAKFWDKKLKNGQEQNLFGGSEPTKRIRINSGTRKKSPAFQKLMEIEATRKIDVRP